MQAKIWNYLSNAGVNNEHQPSAARYIILTNRFGMICGLISLFILLLVLISLGDSGWNITRSLILISVFLFFGVVVLNARGYYNLAKWLISWLPTVVAIVISIADKIYLAETISIKDFFIYRFLIMSTSIIPLLVFTTADKKVLFFNLLPSFVGTVFFEHIHSLFGVSLGQFGLNDPHFYLLDVFAALGYFAMVGFLINQRFVADQFERRLYRQQSTFEQKNKELRQKNSYIKDQNREMNAQSEKLQEANNALLDAKETIEKQKHQLEDQNRNLEALIEQNTKDLSRVNEELIVNNNELRQFSHTLSHNLKSPVATFQGLLNLVDINSMTAENKELFTYLNNSVDAMQTVFSDMNEMLELRKKLYISTEPVNLQREIDSLHNNFYLDLQRNNIHFESKCNSVEDINTNGKRLNGILYQLISNAIKFRSEKRDPQLKVTLNGNDKYHSIRVWDNGIGIDLEKYKNKLFYPYQKFHRRTAGKGLGLYLVKLQTESLGGMVNLKSEPDQFTEVEILLKK